MFLDVTVSPFHTHTSRYTNTPSCRNTDSPGLDFPPCELQASSAWGQGWELKGQILKSDSLAGILTPALRSSTALCSFIMIALHGVVMLMETTLGIQHILNKNYHKPLILMQYHIIIFLSYLKEKQLKA